MIVEWLDDPVGPDRDMKVLREFGFRDGRGERWVVPEGAVINGASIPRLLWREAGSPFVGDYRKASVIHDHYCTTKERSWKATHRVFYDAMIAAGMPELQAKIYYGAVYGGGPRWARIAGVGPGGPEVRVTEPEFTEQDFEALEELVRREDPSLAALEAQIDRMVRP